MVNEDALNKVIYHEDHSGTINWLSDIVFKQEKILCAAIKDAFNKKLNVYAWRIALIDDKKPWYVIIEAPSLEQAEKEFLSKGHKLEDACLKYFPTADKRGELVREMKLETPKMYQKFIKTGKI